jgi:hypothetical protein
MTKARGELRQGIAGVAVRLERQARTWFCGEEPYFVPLALVFDPLLGGRPESRVQSSGGLAAGNGTGKASIHPFGPCSRENWEPVKAHCLRERGTPSSAGSRAADAPAGGIRSKS